jgi:hypothetical protein
MWRHAKVEYCYTTTTQQIRNKRINITVLCLLCAFAPECIVIDRQNCNSILTFSFFNFWVISKIWGFHGGDYDDYNLLGDDAVWLL